jgi:coenzyme F420-reducing hydrogenase delta subunit
VKYVKEILTTTGISPERVQMFHCSAAEGQKFQNEATRISELIQDLGSNPIKESIKSEKEKDSKKTQKNN